VTAELMELAPKLRAWGARAWAWTILTWKPPPKRGVLVMSTPGGNSVSVAEHTFALLLALARQVPRLDRAIHEGRWEKSSAAGTEVRGKTLGLIGLGRIGSEVACARKPLTCACWPTIRSSAKRPAREVSVELVPLDILLAESDFVSLHTRAESRDAKT